MAVDLMQGTRAAAFTVLIKIAQDQQVAVENRLQAAIAILSYSQGELNQDWSYQPEAPVIDEELELPVTMEQAAEDAS